MRSCARGGAVADLTFDAFALALAPSLGVPGKPSHELTVVAERVYDALVGAGVDIRAVVEGTHSAVALRRASHRYMLEMRGIETPCAQCGGTGTRSYANSSTWRGGAGGQSITHDVCDACWGTGDAHRTGANLRLAGTKPDLSRLRELEAKWSLGALALVELRAPAEVLAICAAQLTAALDAIEKGGA